MKTKLMNELFKWSVLSAIIAVAMPDLSFAASGDMNDLIHTVASKQLPALPYALSAVCYVGGSFMLVSGALALKKHAENPASTPMSQGIARLVTGGAITGVPALTGVIQNSTTLGSGSAASFASFSTTF